MPRPFQKHPHPQRLGKLNRYQPPMAPDVVFMLQMSQHPLILSRIAFQPGNPIL